MSNRNVNVNRRTIIVLIIFLIAILTLVQTIKQYKKFFTEYYTNDYTTATIESSFLPPNSVTEFKLNLNLDLKPATIYKATTTKTPISRSKVETTKPTQIATQTKNDDIKNALAASVVATRIIGPVRIMHVVEKEIKEVFQNHALCDIKKKNTPFKIQHDNNITISCFLADLDTQPRRPKGNYETDNTVVITIRDPIDLFMSWYANLQPISDFNLRALSLCYKTIDDLTSIGLQYNAGNDVRTRVCPMRAKICALGGWYRCKILQQNQNYFKELLELYPDKNLYVLRIPYLYEDWRSVSDILGPVPNQKIQLKQHKMTKMVSEKGRKNLCRILCNEIQLYKQLLHRAINLNYNQTAMTTICPHEYAQTTCPPTTLNYPRVPKQVYNATQNKLLHHSLTNRNLAFIHIGKTGGTTATKMIRRQCTLNSASSCLDYVAINEYKNIPRHETQISLQVQEYYHVRKPNITKYNSFIVSIRHPIQRLLSWFIHQHPKNQLIGSTRSSSPQKVFQCFTEFNDLATIGLSPLPEGTKLGKRDCQTLARNYTLGLLRGYEHAVHNYNFYTSDLLLAPQFINTKEIFALRTEYFWYDWQTIHNILGGGTATTTENITKIKPFTHRAGREHKMVITNKTISPQGLIQLCHYLCTEIQLYKRLLKRAVNLSPVDRRNSFTELNLTCPIETLEDSCIISS